MTVEPTPAQQNPFDESDPLDSRTAYVVGGAFLAAIAGGLEIAGMERQLGSSVGLAMVSVTAAGGLVGLELHATRSWVDKGDAMKFARWLLAFVSAGITVGSALHLFGFATRADYYMILVASGVFGIAWGAQALRDDDKELTAKWRRWVRERRAPLR